MGKLKCLLLDILMFISCLYCQCCGLEYRLGYVVMLSQWRGHRVALSHHSLPTAQPACQEGQERAELTELAELRRSSTEQGAVRLPADVEGEAVDVTVPALSAQHPHHGHLGVGGVGVAGVLGPGRHVCDEVCGVVVCPLSDTLVTATLPQAGMTGCPGHVPPVVLAAAQLDGVGQLALSAGLRGHPGLPVVRPHRQAEVGLGDADTEQPRERTGRVRPACSRSGHYAHWKPRHSDNYHNK